MLAASYVGFQILAAVLAVVVFRAVRPQRGTEDEVYKLPRKLLAEFIGTFFLVLTVGLNVQASSKAGAFSIAAALMCMIYALGDVSGANFNPAVSVTLLLAGVFDFVTTLSYICAQILGGIAAAMIQCALYNGKTLATGTQAGYVFYQAAAAEVVFTMVLCMVVLCTAVKENTKSKAFFGWIIGSCVTVGGTAIGGISGGSLNPAVTIGLATVSNTAAWGATYTTFQIVGACLAASVVLLTHAPAEKAEARDFEKEALKA